MRIRSDTSAITYTSKRIMRSRHHASEGGTRKTDGDCWQVGFGHDERLVRFSECLEKEDHLLRRACRMHVSELTSLQIQVHHCMRPIRYAVHAWGLVLIFKGAGSWKGNAAPNWCASGLNVLRPKICCDGSGRPAKGLTTVVWYA